MRDLGFLTPRRKLYSQRATLPAFYGLDGLPQIRSHCRWRRMTPLDLALASEPIRQIAGWRGEG